MEHSPLTPPVRPKRSPWRVAVLLLLPAAAGLLLFGGRSHAPLQPPPVLAQDMPPPPEPQFSTRPTPAGDVSFQNLRFQPLEVSGFPALAPRLKVAYRDGLVTITNDWPKAEEVWSGPVADASFVAEMRGGVNTLKDTTGKVLWSDAADIAKPDLLFVKMQDGNARLSGADGATLWAGLLPPTIEGGGSTRGQGDQVSIVTPSVSVNGAGGVFRVTSGKLLWTGRLRPSPLIVIRDGRSYTIVGPNGGSSGSDQTRRVIMAAEAVTVTVADTKGRALGTQAVDGLDVRYEVAGLSYPRGHDVPFEHRSQEGELNAVGTLLLTYRDSAGRVLRRVTVYKDAHGGSGRMG